MTKEEINNRTECPSLMELGEYLYGSIGKKEGLAISSHLSSCPYCEDEMHELKEFVGENPQDEFNKYYATHKLDRSPLPERLSALVKKFSMKETTGIQMLKENLRSLIGNIKRLESGVSFQLTTFALDPLATKGGEQDKDVYDTNKRITINLEAPLDEDGFVTVFRYDERDDFQMILPKSKIDNTSLKAGGFKRLTLDPLKFKGMHYVKAVVTSQMLINPNEIDFEDDLDVAIAVGNFLKSVRDLDYNEWWEANAEFRVT